MLVTALSTLSIAVFCRGVRERRRIARQPGAGAGAGDGVAARDRRESALRLVRQLVTESLGIATAGAAGGIGVAWVGIRLLRQVRYPTELFWHPRFELNERALVVGAADRGGECPAGQSRPGAPDDARRSRDEPEDIRSRSTGTLIGGDGRSVLVAAQVALSLVLLTITVYTLQMFSRELVAGPGFRITEHDAGYGSPRAGGLRRGDEAERFFTQPARRRSRTARCAVGVGHLGDAAFLLQVRVVAR